MNLKDTTRKEKIIIGAVVMIVLIIVEVVIFLLGGEPEQFSIGLIIVITLIALVISVLFGSFMCIGYDYCSERIEE